MNRVAFATLGCKTNQYETDALMDLFYKNRFDIVSFDDHADIYIINTCTVTHVGDKKSRQMIRRAKKNNPESIVVVMGCYAQISTEEVGKIEEVDIVVGTDARGKILDYIHDYIEGKHEKPYVIVDDIMNISIFENMSLDSVATHTRAFVKIQEGCNQYCSYCIIPYARGRVRSRSPENVVDEIVRLAEKGYKEFVLTGIHIGSYGIDLENIALMDLVEAIHEVDGVERIRLGSIEPRLITDAFADRIKNLPKICDHFHLSLQSGSDSILKRMNRKYTAEQFEMAVGKLRAIYPSPSITTDIIVGFPGETDEEFTETYEFVKKIHFSEMHIFPFSKREGTPAAIMPNQVPAQIKKKRADMLSGLEIICRTDYINQFENEVSEVLVEEMKDGLYIGHTKNYLKVHLKSDKVLKLGEIYPIRLKKIALNQLFGEFI
ncbi:MAG: tRNA (N(6)-L-threonylcarbamoyladenosine(37)-C(2))-methylthiotransferase MtaB [Clostridia bacterium]|nr:tRNA (N(6)-L-threonylcarbamoyladenosine(37)-C(2))-methylthiotransferase MtaB [Clostridia bacterium]